MRVARGRTRDTVFSVTAHVTLMWHQAATEQLCDWSSCLFCRPGSLLTFPHIDPRQQHCTDCKEKDHGENGTPAGAGYRNGPGENEGTKDAGKFLEHTEESEELT